MRDNDMIHDELETLRPILQHIVWSCNIAFSGHFPSCGLDGRKLPPGKFQRAGEKLAPGFPGFGCAELKGDWLYHQRMLRLKAIPVARNVCFLCDAVRDDASDFRYYNVEGDAAWRSSEVSAAGFLNEKVRPGPLRHLNSFEQTFSIDMIRKSINHAYIIQAPFAFFVASIRRWYVSAPCTWPTLDW